MGGAFSFSGSTVQRSLTLGTSFSTIGVEGDIHVSTSSSGFHLPLTPPLMTSKEKHLATVRRLEEPPLCECRDRAMINHVNTLEFVCPNKHEVGEKYICLNVYLYMCACTNVFSRSVMDLRSVVSMSGSTVLRINGRSHQKAKKKEERKVNIQSTCRHEISSRGEGIRASRKGLLDRAIDLPGFNAEIIDPAHSSRDVPVNLTLQLTRRES